MRGLFASNVLTVRAEDRFADVAAEIARRGVSHCVVLEEPQGDYVGLVRVREAAVKPPQRIFADLLSPAPAYRLGEEGAETTIQDLVSHAEEAVVFSANGRVAGVVTRESLRAWQERQGRQREPKGPRRSSRRDRRGAVLDKRIQTQGAALRRALGDLEEVAQAISHDLRTPLRVIQGYAKALKQDCGRRLDEPARSYIERMDRAAARLDQLTLGVLKYAEVARAPIKLKPVDLDRVVAQAIGKTRPALDRATVKTQRPLGVIRSDQALLTTCVAELLENAVKFCPRDRACVARVGVERERGVVKLWVEDNGIGVKPEHRRRIFQLFEQVHPENAYAGSGVGLAVVRRAVDRLGGIVGIDSVAGGGSRFWLKLPV